MPNNNVLVFGSINVDLIAHSDSTSQKDKYTIGSHFQTNLGGKGLNVALGCAAFNPHKVDFVGRVGNDIYGKFVLESLTKKGLGAENIVEDPEHSTGIGHLRVDQEGEYDTIVIQGANDALCGRDFDSYVASHGLPSLIITNLETPFEAIHHISVNKGQSKLVINVSPWISKAIDVLSLADVAVLNLSESRTIMGLDDNTPALDAVNALRAHFSGAIVVTLGEDGVMALDENGTLYQLNGDAVVPLNTVGAGDSFLAGFIMSMSKGTDFEEALEVGNAAGRLVCLRSDSHLVVSDIHELELALGQSPRRKV